MDRPHALTLRDGRAARVRPASVADALRLVELDRVLAADGRGMVIGVEQVRRLADEERRLDEVFRARSAGDATLAVVAEVDGDPRIAASADLRQLAPARCHHVGVLSVGVHPAFQRQGLGRALMKMLVEHARTSGLVRLELYVRADNARARQLYRSLGFVHEGTRARFVREADGSFVDDHIFAYLLDGA